MGASQEAVFNREELLLARRLSDYASRAPIAAMTSALSAMICWAILPADRAGPWLLACMAWLLGTCAISAARIVQSRRLQTDTIDLGYIRRHALIALALALTDALVWGAGVAVVGLLADLSGMVIVCVLMVCLLVAAALNLRSMPAIGSTLTISLATGGCIGAALRDGPADTTAIAIVAFFALIVLHCIRVDAADYDARFRAEFELGESADTISLLLRDYEDQSADWLWQVNQAGCLTDVCERFGQAAGQSPDLLEGQELVGLFEPGPHRELFAYRIREREPFRDHMLKLAGDPVRWWVLSATAREDGTMRGVARDVTSSRQTEQRVAYMAHHDGLTGLANRFLFSETLSDQLARQRRGESCALLYLDLDHFKAINDTFGHSSGDLLLTEAARRIKSKVKVHDLVARLGGDEFAVLLTRFASEDDALSVADRIVEAMDDPFVIEGQRLRVSASAGVAFFHGQGGKADDLLRQADLALYAAKGNGRACRATFEPWMEDKERERAALEADLRMAIAEGQFALHFQPLINIADERIAGFEALVRWEHPQYGVVMPGEFIPIAEDTGLIVPLGEWIMRNAIEQAAGWTDRQRVAINLSPIQLRSPRLLPLLVNAIADTGIDPARIELEITENVLMQDSEANVAILHSLRELGVRFSLDDFGTGYSSLNYLRSFPFDKIKIDKCFLHDLQLRPDCQAIIRTVTALASMLGMDTTVEGVESGEQLEWLREQGCTEVQGFYISYPFNVEELSDGRPFGETDDGVPQYLRRLSDAA